jgi:hypothetical protein
MRRAAKRDAVEDELVLALRQCGCDVFLTSVPFDAIVGYRGVNHLVEFKSGKAGRYTEAQKRFMESWRGAKVITLRSTEDAIKWVTSLAGRSSATTTS